MCVIGCLGNTSRSSHRPIQQTPAMKVQLILPLSVAVSLAAFALMKVRVKEFATEEKKAKFQDVKLRVTNDVLAGYEKEKTTLEKAMEKEKAAHETLQQALTGVSNDDLKTELDACAGVKKTAAQEITSVQKQIKTFQAASAKEKADWEAEITALKEKLNAVSPICNFLKPGSSVQGCPEKKEEPKIEPPKQTEEKKEPPKPEEKKEPPKPEEKEPPKPEEKEPPKPEEAPKQDAPKQ